MIKNRDALKKYKATKLPEDFITYKRLRNYTLGAIRREKKAYLDFTLKNFNVTPNKSYEIPSHISEDVNGINNYFSSVALNMNNDCSELIEFYNNNKLGNDTHFNFVFAEPSDIGDVIKGLTSDAVGTDGISRTMLNYCLPVLLLPITHIINVCLEVGYFPNHWKHAKVCPVPKISTPKNYSDLRPISILPFLSKILEKVVYKQLYIYCIENKILPSHQSGFRAGHSTASALINICDDVLHEWDKRRLTALITLDFSKAFDTMNHKLLYSKLDYYQFAPTTKAFFESFLTNRSQKVVVDSKESSSINISSGVPQGSILGPLLFLIYTADLSKSLSHCKSHFCADDSQLYYSFPPNDAETANYLINQDLRSVIALSKKHNLHINPNKSSLLIFGNKIFRAATEIKISITVENVPLPLVSVTKNLGLVLDSDLKFTSHISKCVQKAYSTLKLLYSNRHVLNQNLRKLLCEQLVLSFFNYCDIVYGPCIDLFDASRIQKVQNSCCRLILNLRKFEHISKHISSLNWLNMKNRRLLHSATFFHKIILTHCPLYLRDKIKYRADLHSINIRQPLSIHIPQHSTKKYQSSFSYQLPYIYNNVNDSLKLEPSKSFRGKFKSHLLDKQRDGHIKTSN